MTFIQKKRKKRKIGRKGNTDQNASLVFTSTKHVSCKLKLHFPTTKICVSTSMVLILINNKVD